MVRKHLLVTITGMIAVLMFAGAVYAEGEWESFINGASEGFYSRWWKDNDTDDIGTSVRFDGCSSNVEVILWRDVPFSPFDTNLGSRAFQCGGSDVHNWGDQPAKDYRFEVDQIFGANTVNVNFVRVEY